MSKIPIIFSTVTGNAFKLAETVSSEVPDFIGPYNIRYFKDEFLEKYDTFILSYWCDKGSADKDTIELIGRMRGKKLIIIGTAGVTADSAHANAVRERIEVLANAENTLAGQFLCQGAVDIKRTAERLKLPEGQRGHLTHERFERHKQSQGHPNEKDLSDACAAVREFIGRL